MRLHLRNVQILNTQEEQSLPIHRIYKYPFGTLGTKEGRLGFSPGAHKLRRKSVRVTLSRVRQVVLVKAALTKAICVLVLPRF